MINTPTGFRYVRDLNRIEWGRWLRIVNEAHAEYNAIEMDRRRPLAHKVLDGVSTGQVWGRARTMFVMTHAQCAFIDVSNRRWHFWGDGFLRNSLVVGDVSRIRLYDVVRLAA